MKNFDQRRAAKSLFHDFSTNYFDFGRELVIDENLQYPSCIKYNDSYFTDYGFVTNFNQLAGAVAINHKEGEFVIEEELLPTGVGITDLFDSLGMSYMSFDKRYIKNEK
jgi:hypothetical protein